jgi:dTDP-4-dehydrorhamnose reductase
MNTILVLGAGGQLGHCLKALAERTGMKNVLFPEEQEADILKPEALSALFNKLRPAWVINCAAYTAVDKAEQNEETALLINKTGVENISRCCEQLGTRLIHISTDFVFEGSDVRLLTEMDEAHPVNVYGATKLDGEKAIAMILPHYFILRTSWLYSEHGNNFVKTMLRLGAERDSLSVIADQVGTPTYAPDLAACIFEIIRSESEAYGIYHYSNEGTASWFDFAKAIFDLSGTTVNVEPIPTSAYPTPARRPAFSVLDKTKVKNTFNVDVPYWRHSLERCIRNLGIH